MSGLSRAMKCPASMFMPQSHRQSEYANLGTSIHLFLQNAGKGKEKALEIVLPEHRLICEHIDLSGLPINPNEWSTEVSFVYDAITDMSEVLLAREYPPPEFGKIHGTVDVVGLADNCVIIVDYKSGFADLGKIENNVQVKAYCLAAARAFKKRKAIGTIIHIRPNKEHVFEKAEFDEMDLDAFAEELKAFAIKVEEPSNFDASKTSEGSWCRYCPAFHVCPAKITLATSLNTEMEKNLSAILSKETAPEIYKRLIAAEDVLERVRLVLKDWCRHSPIDLGNGRVFGVKEHREEKIDALAAEPFLNTYGLADAIEIKKTVTKVALGNAIKDHRHYSPQLEGESHAAKVEWVLDELRRICAIRETYSERTREFNT